MKKYCIKNKTVICHSIIILLISITVSGAQIYAGDASGKVEDGKFSFENRADGVPEKLQKELGLYWKYKGQRQFSLSYEIEAPHIRYQLPLETYIQYHAKARNLKGSRVLNIKEDAGLAFVTVELLFADKDKPAKSTSKTQIINDRWIELNGNWYHVYTNPFASIR